MTKNLQRTDAVFAVILLSVRAEEGSYGAKLS